MEEIPNLIEAIRARGWKLGSAESCTGGLFSAAVAALAGVSDVFQGSIVSYANDVKVGVLGVKNETLDKFGAVSEEVAREMAKGAALRLKCDVSISITGIAGPTGGSVEKPVGTVWFCAYGPDFEVTEKKLFLGARMDIQKQAVSSAAELLFFQLRRA